MIEKLEDIKSYGYPLWGPLLWHGQIDDDFHSFLENTYKKASENFTNKLAGRIETEFKFDNDDATVISEYMAPYIAYYLGMFYSDFYKVSFEGSICSTIEAVWVNIQKAKEYNPLHAHSGHLSFVIYQDINSKIYNEFNKSNSNPNGSIAFEVGAFPRPLYGNEDLNKSKSINILADLGGKNNHVFTPKTKDILIFPSNLKHTVIHFDSEDVERVTIAGNILLSDVQ